jgi:hypothetical protein
VEHLLGQRLVFLLVAPRGRVPAMGRYSTLPWCTRTSSSGDDPGQLQGLGRRF